MTHSACHVNLYNVDRRSLSQIVLHDVASIICQALRGGDLRFLSRCWRWVPAVLQASDGGDGGGGRCQGRAGSRRRARGHRAAHR